MGKQAERVIFNALEIAALSLGLGNLAFGYFIVLRGEPIHLSDGLRERLAGYLEICRFPRSK
jgi:hypothetical protein